MSITAAILLPIYLASSAIALGDGGSAWGDQTVVSESESVPDCSETVLRFVVGGIPAETESDYCSSSASGGDQVGS
tara:strand:- start:218 stop:445 length:228 start_codon:yes stop_codon:yes gene_type:complete